MNSQSSLSKHKRLQSRNPHKQQSKLHICIDNAVVPVCISEPSSSSYCRVCLSFLFCFAFELMSSLLPLVRPVMGTHESEVYTVAPEMPAMFDGMKLAAVATVLYIIVRCLNLKSPTAPPDITYQDTPLSRFLLKSCPLLTKE